MDATLDEWVRFVFDHAVTEAAWYFDTDAPYLLLPPERAAHLIAETFERGAERLRRFTAHDACRESALHGLGHLALFDPEAAPIADTFIARSHDVRPELLAYARQARTGHIR
jgi:hypothetical protein